MENRLCIRGSPVFGLGQVEFLEIAEEYGRVALIIEQNEIDCLSLLETGVF